MNWSYDTWLTLNALLNDFKALSRDKTELCCMQLFHLKHKNDLFEQTSFISCLKWLLSLFQTRNET